MRNATHPLFVIEAAMMARHEATSPGFKEICSILGFSHRKVIEWIDQYQARILNYHQTGLDPDASLASDQVVVGIGRKISY